MHERRRHHAVLDRANQGDRSVVDEDVDVELDAAADLVVGAVQVVVLQADGRQPVLRGGVAALRAVAGDVDPVVGDVPGVDDVDRVRIGLRAGDGRVGVGVRHVHPQLLVAQAADLPGVLVVIGQLDAEAALGRVGQLVPVVVQRGVDVDGDAHACETLPCPDYPHTACRTSP